VAGAGPLNDHTKSRALFTECGPLFTERLALLFQREDIGIEDLHGFLVVRHQLRVISHVFSMIGHVFRVVSFLRGDGFRVLPVPALHPPVHQP